MYLHTLKIISQNLNLLICKGSDFFLLESTTFYQKHLTNLRKYYRNRMHSLWTPGISSNISEILTSLIPVNFCARNTLSLNLRLGPLPVCCTLICFLQISKSIPLQTPYILKIRHQSVFIVSFIDIYINLYSCDFLHKFLLSYLHR